MTLVHAGYSYAHTIIGKEILTNLNEQFYKSNAASEHHSTFHRYHVLNITPFENLYSIYIALIFMPPVPFPALFLSESHSFSNVLH